MYNYIIHGLCNVSVTVTVEHQNTGTLLGSWYCKVVLGLQGQI